MIVQFCLVQCHITTGRGTSITPLAIRKMYALNILVILGALCLQTLAVPAIPKTRQNPPSVVVVGGGVAGIRAASLLNAEGYNVTLLEAGSRVGGRIMTVKLGDGRHLEMGGEWVHGETNNSIFELVSPLGLFHPTKKAKETVIAPFEYGNFIGIQTGEVLNRTLTERIEQFLDYIWFDPEEWGAELEEDVSQGEWARWMLNRFNEVYPIHDNATFLEAVFDWAHRASNAEESSTSWYNVSGSDEGEQYVWLDGAQNVRWLPPYSYASLSELILTGTVTEDNFYPLPEYVKLGREVTNIQYSTNGNTVTVTASNGEQFVADHVIFTPSLGVLKANHLTLFTPPLRAQKQLAINNIGFGSVSKVNLEFAEPWWPLDFEGLFPLWNDIDYSNASLQYWREDITDAELLEEYDGIPLWVRSILSFHNVDSGSAPNVLRTWISGNPSTLVDRMDPVYVQDHVMNVMHKFLDATFPNITEPVVSYKSFWSTNPLFRGTYSYRRLESDTQNVWARDLAEPIEHLASTKPLVCFAGEATHPNYYATVHGAYDTGVREAERIITWWRDNGRNE